MKGRRLRLGTATARRAPTAHRIQNMTTPTSPVASAIRLLSTFPVLAFGVSLRAQSTKPVPVEPVVELEKFVMEEHIEDPAGVLPKAPIAGVFGGTKSILETPRAISSVSTEMLEQYGIENIEGLAAIVPNSYTASSFGIAGSLDLRGTSAENYFRGMKRIENGGVYPTPIGATDRVDIVRGPPSPVFGPGKIGGYLNFIPKAARASTGKYLSQPTGKGTLTYGSYDKRIMTLEQGGPLALGERNAGYYVYVLMENSGSWYRNAGQEQFIVQSSFDVQINDSWRLEAGQQYHSWSSIELSGINRLTQDYIDHGTYLSGRPLLNLDSNGDGVISPAELNAAGGVSISVRYGTPASAITLPASFGLDPATVKYVQLPDNAILSDAGDFANATASIFFADLINDKNPDLTFANKIIVDTLKRTKDTSQGFATRAQGFLFEDKFAVEQKLEPASWLHVNNSASASVRYFDGENRSWTAFQPFNRRDLSVGATVYDRILSANDNPSASPWNANRQSEYTDYGVGALTDVTFARQINLILGARYDFIDLWASADPNSTGDGAITSAAKTTGVSNEAEGFSYSTSVSYVGIPNVIPYFTHSKQQSLQIGNIGDVIPANVPTPLTDSALYEAGVKFSLLKDKLFAGVSAYRQTRSAINPDTFESFTTQAKGTEFELRYVPTKRLSVSASAAWQKTIYLKPPTTFTVPAEFFGLDPAKVYGGLINVTNLPATGDYTERGGYPDHVFSLYGTYTFTRGLGLNLGAIYQTEMSSGSAKTFILPEVLKWDGAIFYSFQKWDLRLRVNNITDERYFQANSPDNNGNTVALPKLPRTYEVTVGYKF